MRDSNSVTYPRAQQGFTSLDSALYLGDLFGNARLHGENRAEFAEDVAFRLRNERSPDLFRSEQIGDRMTRAGRTGDNQRPPAGTVPPLSSYPGCAVCQQSGRYRNRGPGSKK
jgi:hypothetical protein